MTWYGMVWGEKWLVDSSCVFLTLVYICLSVRLSGDMMRRDGEVMNHIGIRTNCLLFG